MINKLLVILLVIVFLVGCATTSVDVPVELLYSPPEQSEKEFCEIKGSKHRGCTYIATIDGKYLKDGINNWDIPTRLRIREQAIVAEFRSGSSYSKVTFFSFSPEHGKSYEVRSAHKKRLISFWIHDLSTNKPASEVKKAAIKTDTGGAFIPIFIPVSN